MLEIEKACACVVRAGRVLLFRHPSAGVQLPKGTIEAGEAPDVAVVRELFEESGLRIKSAPAHVATRVFQRRANGVVTNDPIERQTWHIFALSGDASIPEQWEHVAEGSPEEAGLRFAYFWHPLAIDFGRAFPDSDPVFGQVVRVLGAFIES